jgi:hypothetical protein
MNMERQEIIRQFEEIARVERCVRCLHPKLEVKCTGEWCEDRIPNFACQSAPSMPAHLQMCCSCKRQYVVDKYGS